MAIIAAFLLGLVIGAWRARRAGRPLGDQIQWGLAHAIGLTLLVMILGTIFLNVST
ncbi:MAG: hypothetical protein AAF429_05435 [Pseudomonadota bacterium]